MDIDDPKATVENILVSVPEYMRKVQCDTHKYSLPFKCAVVSCTNKFFSFEERDKYPYKFHNFPNNQKLCQIWKVRCGLEAHADIINLKVCSDHFELDDYIRNYKAEFSDPNFKRRLNSNAVPNKNINARIGVIKNEDLNFDDVKEAVDEHEILNEKYQALLEKKSRLEQKFAAYNKKIPSKSEEVARLRKILQGFNMKQKMELKEWKNVVQKVFSNAQVNLLLGKERVFWSEDDLAKAFTLRHIGTKECYLYLKNTLNMPLPALACVQKWAASGGPS